MCDCMQIFKFPDGHVTTFRHPSDIDVKNVPEKIKNVKNVKNVTKIKKTFVNVE